MLVCRSLFIIHVSYSCIMTWISFAGGWCGITRDGIHGF